MAVVVGVIFVGGGGGSGVNAGTWVNGADVSKFAYVGGGKVCRKVKGAAVV